MKKIHSKNDFELCYLRHKYLRRTDINPSKEDIAPYAIIIHKLSGKTYSTYNKIFYAVGLDFMDVVRISDVHLISYLGLFHIQKNPIKYKAFETKFVDRNHFLPAENDILDKNKADFTAFLKQRMEDVVRVCRQKVRNVRGSPIQPAHFYFAPEIPKARDFEIIANYEKLGLRKLDPAVFRSIKKKAKPTNPLRFFFNGNWYISIPTNFQPLSATDFLTSDQFPRDLEHNKNPEEMLMSTEAKADWGKKYKKYKKIPSQQKLSMLRFFIEANKDNSLFVNEIKTANRIVSRLEK
jgi:hypothetical protein